MRVVKRFLVDRHGATTIEYCMIAAMISILIVSGASLIGLNLQTRFFDAIAAGLP